MEKQTVYIETSIISYLTSRPSRDLITAGNQKLTYDWWHKSRPKFDCYISQVVMDEISEGDIDASRRRLDSVKRLNPLDLNLEIKALSNEYLKLLSIPEKSRFDALHLAIATWYKINYILSWNCKHIANARVAYLIREYNNLNSLYVPILCTPNELMEY